MAKKVKTKPRPIRGIPEDPSEAEFRAFQKMLPKLLKKYKDEYVAIYQGKLIGHHIDDCELAQRAYEKVGKAPLRPSFLNEL